MCPDFDLAQALRAIKNGDDSDDLLDNRSLGAVVGWDLDRVAVVLGVAKDRSLVWGFRSGGKPSPWFTDLELTVQGERFLAAAVAQ